MSHLGNASLQGTTTLSPKFIFGVNGNIKNSLFVLDDKKVVYVAGHNIIIYNPIDRTQEFISGTEGSEGINFITMSGKAPLLAFCEKGDQRAQCTVFNLDNKKKQKIIPDDNFELDFKSKEFLSVAFCPKDPNRYMVALCGEPDWCVLLIQHDLFKIHAKIDLGLTSPVIGGTYQISECNVSTDLTVVVTGPSCFRYLTINDGMNSFKVCHDKLTIAKNELQKNITFISDIYTCHAWDQASKLVLCTDQGEIMICDYKGFVQYYFTDSPLGNSIQCIFPVSSGLVLGGSSGYIWAYELKKSQEIPYSLLKSKIGIDETLQVSLETSLNQGDDITSLSMSVNEDQIFFINRNCQLQTIKFTFKQKAVDATIPKFSYLHTAFHSAAITGMDICLRKKLIVTTSIRQINIWNYAEKTLEISHQCQAGEEAAAVAFHPSGFHIVVAFQDKVQFMNVLSNSFKDYGTPLSLKGCREIKFSNGGHLFAAALGTNQIFIYNFYTQECPPNMQCKGHSNKVRCIDWYEDDMGFSSCGMDGNVYFFDLMMQKEQNSRVSDRDFTQKGLIFTGLCNVPGQLYSAIVVGNDKHIYKTNDPDVLSKQSCDTKFSISQVSFLQNGRVFFAGIGEDNRPGSVQIWKSSLEKINEVQGHSDAVERMRISFDNKTLFTSGRDGTLIIYDIKDNTSSGTVVKREFQGIQTFSEVILTEKNEMEELETQKEGLESENAAANENHSGVDGKMGTNQQETEINKLQEELSSAKMQASNKYDQLFTGKQDIEENYEKQIKQQEEAQHEELEARRNEYSQKMLEDAARYQELQTQQELDQNAFTASQQKIFEEHSSAVALHQKNHNDYVEKQKTLIHKLKQEIARARKDNEETINQITEDAKTEYDEIEKKNASNLAQVQDMGLKAKAELQITRNKLTEVEQEIENLSRQIQDKKTQLKQQKETIDKLKTMISDQQKEIHDKDTQIGERERVIYSLKKRTQELEKFKFVLDYKIKDLKRDIAPREAEIGKLKEQTENMDNSLRKFNIVNSQLGFMVNDLRTKQEEMSKLIKASSAKIRKNDIYIQGFKNAVYWVVQFIDDIEQLKLHVNTTLKPYIKGQGQQQTDIDPDIRKEYQNQKKYLESSYNSLQKKLEKEDLIHKQDNKQIMESNMALITEITELRKNVKLYDTLFKKAQNNQRMQQATQKQALNNQPAAPESYNGLDHEGSQLLQEIRNSDTDQETLYALKREADMKRRYIDTMQQTLQQKLAEAQLLAGQFDEAINSGQH